jgi:hypothetical protein
MIQLTKIGGRRYDAVMNLRRQRVGGGGAKRNQERGFGGRYRY